MPSHRQKMIITATLCTTQKDAGSEHDWLTHAVAEELQGYYGMTLMPILAAP